eukprot:jgi/Mesvir1/10454/Mv12085-RA.1
MAAHLAECLNGKTRDGLVEVEELFRGVLAVAAPETFLLALGRMEGRPERAKVVFVHASDGRAIGRADLLQMACIAAPQGAQVVDVHGDHFAADTILVPTAYMHVVRLIKDRLKLGRWTTGGFCSLHRRQAAQPYDRPYLRRPPAPPYRPYHPYYYPYMLHWSAPHISPNHVTVTHVYEPKTDKNANGGTGGDGGVNGDPPLGDAGPVTPSQEPRTQPRTQDGASEDQDNVLGTPPKPWASTACGRP